MPTGFHVYKSGAKTKGWIKNNVSGEKMPFQFNPTEFQHARGATYNEIVAPGMPYPLTQYGHGNAREFSVTLFMYDNPCKGVIMRAESFLTAFLPPEENTKNNYVKPPDMTICVGKFIRRCVLTEYNMNAQRFDEYGNIIQCEITLSVRQV